MRAPDCVVEVRSPQVRFAEVRTLEVGTAKALVAEVHTDEPNTMKILPGEARSRRAAVVPGRVCATRSTCALPARQKTVQFSAAAASTAPSWSTSATASA